jgi:hypothetical protein
MVPYVFWFKILREKDIFWIFLKKPEVLRVNLHDELVKIVSNRFSLQRAAILVPIGKKGHCRGPSDHSLVEYFRSLFLFQSLFFVKEFLFVCYIFSTDTITNVYFCQWFPTWNQDPVKTYWSTLVLYTTIRCSSFPWLWSKFWFPVKGFTRTLQFCQLYTTLQVQNRGVSKECWRDVSNCKHCWLSLRQTSYFKGHCLH